jgi:hypothetical protein
LLRHPGCSSRPTLATIEYAIEPFAPLMASPIRSSTSRGTARDILGGDALAVKVMT